MTHNLLHEQVDKKSILVFNIYFKIYGKSLMNFLKIMT